MRLDGSTWGLVVSIAFPGCFVDPGWNRMQSDNILLRIALDLV